MRGSNRVIRGGSWNNNPQNCRVANRNNNSPDNRNNNIGFRLSNMFMPVWFNLRIAPQRLNIPTAVWHPASAGPNISSHQKAGSRRAKVFWF
jgi:hypothetical protein